MIQHPIKPVFDQNSRILILGSFPSVKSREAAFFYGHPQNRFWRVISAVIESDEPRTIEEKRNLLIQNHIAVWDVIASCEIEGSADSTIKNVRANDIGQILAHANIQAIFVNGKTAQKYYDRYIKPTIGREAICLPSTSPANATFGLDRLIDAWKEICQYLQK
jgi:hypoxanthine-DNA glycosylase